MSGKSRFAVLLVALLLVASTGAAYASAQTDGAYSVEAQNTIDIPDRTVSVEGTDYTVSSIGKVTAGETLEATTSGPDGEEFDVDLYSGDQELINSDVGTDGSVSFSTENLQPGTYILAVYTADGSIVSPQPVVVAGYETTLDAPSEMTAGQSSDVTVQLDDVADLGSPENVELVITQDDEVVDTVQMNSESTYEYTAEIGSSLESGEYRMYAMVHNETTVGGENALGDDNDIVGVTDAKTLSVSSGEGQPQDGSSDDGSAGGSGSGSSASADTDTSTPSETGTTAIGTTEMAETTDESSTATTEAAMTESQTETPGTSTDSSMPNFALYIVALALVAAALVARR
ncbi:hypothetical protein C474_08602 [Halogeometricum pallidum JCM 14848]|uniref:Cell surface glycoprotein n=1 Tax=Halogeometricum pallidum JCM 14848 TaxID=1227487 RepID=M0D941_HALPD|nr:hypothetical protein [Halogeometricum pallidum]ELZ31348.1 hypothetical protein C474_08602 [Halogeometricum pallidum JCM 14848]